MKSSHVLVLLAISTGLMTLSGCSTGYEKEGNAVYYKSWNEGSGSIKYPLDADPQTFQILGNDTYAKDRQKVFYRGDIIKGADATSFEALDEDYARDKNHGYYQKERIISSKGATFQVIDGDYSTDGTNVFYGIHPLNTCSARNFHILYKDATTNWATDGCFYYCGEYRVPSEDYTNVEIYRNSGGLAKDKRYVYFLDHKLNYDIDGKKVVDSIDATSFTVTGFLECHDKWGCFNPYHGRKNCSDN